MIRTKLIKICLLAIGAIGIFAPQVWAVKILESSQTAKDLINSNSEAIPLPGRIGYRPGVPYKFEAQAGDEITITVSREAESNIDIALIVKGPNREAKLINDNQDRGKKEVFRGSIEFSGTWKISVISLNEKSGNYQISLEIKRNGIVLEPLPKVRSSLPESWGLTQIDCQIGSGIVFIAFEDKTLCALPTDALPVGRYLYDKKNNQLIPLESESSF